MCCHPQVAAYTNGADGCCPGMFALHAEHVRDEQRCQLGRQCEPAQLVSRADRGTGGAKCLPTLLRACTLLESRVSCTGAARAQFAMHEYVIHLENA